MMIAVYRLSKRLPCFDYYYWQAQVQAQGATKIVFDLTNPKTRKFPLDDVMRRYHSILEPGPALAGLKSRIGTDHGGLDAGVGEIFEWHKLGKPLPRMRTVKPPVKCDYTVTIRENLAGVRARDSNPDAWYKFAEQIGAVVIEDYYRKPIHLHDRIALYAGARMNFGVCNGPLALLSLTEYPMMMFVNSWKARQSQERCGIYDPAKLPWMLDNQHMVWQEDTLDNLMRTFETEEKKWDTATT